ncbi:hypothetical protein [Lysobacter arvi]|uniref:Uncharacterized protein n=1 Tax=Lysobacter arvi TaxID=3038776 RepID=A0ABU1CA14_9GAMM|nr:hypothetical protein [Lysobacter arvi]MDR0182006.1 hypothetical protein [Lysobacter arvi]
MSNDPNPWAPPELEWPELQAQLDALRGSVERMLQETTDTSQVVGKFAGMASDIVSRSPPDLVESVNSELGAILRDLRLTGDSMD